MDEEFNALMQNKTWRLVLEICPRGNYKSGYYISLCL
jgi:hypothetical protein